MEGRVSARVVVEMLWASSRTTCTRDVEVRSREAAGTVSKPLDVDTLYEQQSSTQRIPGDIACWGVFR